MHKIQIQQPENTRCERIKKLKWQRVKYQPNTPLGANGQKVTASKAHTELSKAGSKGRYGIIKE